MSATLQRTLLCLYKINLFILTHAIFSYEFGFLCLCYFIYGDNSIDVNRSNQTPNNKTEPYQYFQAIKGREGGTRSVTGRQVSPVLSVHGYIWQMVT